MKLIDEKGKLFGKLNIIDALVLVILVLAVALVGVKVWNNYQAKEPQQQEQQNPNTDKPEEYWVVYTVKVTEVDPAVYEVMTRFVDRENGMLDQMLTTNGLQDGYVVDVQATPHVTYVECSDGTVKRVESSGEDDRLDLYVTCVANVKDYLFHYMGSQEIRTGAHAYILKTVHFQFVETKILSVDQIEDRTELSEFVDLDVLDAVREELLAGKTVG